MTGEVLPNCNYCKLNVCANFNTHVNLIGHVLNVWNDWLSVHTIRKI